MLVLSSSSSIVTIGVMGMKISRRNFERLVALTAGASMLGAKSGRRFQPAGHVLAESLDDPAADKIGSDGFVEQRGSNPVEVKDRGITYLMADEARHSLSLKKFAPPHNPPCKRFWIQNWRRPDQVFEWNLTTQQSGRYKPTIMASVPKGTIIVIKVLGTSSSSECKPSSVFHHDSGYNWERFTAHEPLHLPKGRISVRVQLLNSIEAAPVKGALKSVELLNVEMQEAMDHRVRAFRSSTSWLNRAKFGLMFQWGEWGYPRHGAKKKWPAMVEDFDVPKFADMVASSQAGYVVWSATWRTYYFPAPINAIDRILPGRTSRRDLIGEIADALRERSMKLILYYHLGHGDREWWDKNWVSIDDKKLLFHNWINIMNEIGERYKGRLAGWLYDDGCVYYPAPYERLGRAAKAGFRERIISYNPWIIARGTDFQDFQFGEGFHGDKGTPVGGSGIYSAGPYQGLHAHGCFMLDGPGWGIYRPNTVIAPPRFSKDKAIAIALNAAARNQALSWNLLMYEDGSVSRASLDLMRAVGKAVRKNYPL